MKMFAFVALACLAGFAAAENHCYNDVTQNCGPVASNPDLPNCNAKYGGFEKISTELQAYANLHLERSYEYLLHATFFNSYQTNRGGFAKTFKKLSDESWAKAIDIIKHVTKRGGEMNFKARSTAAPATTRNLTVELHEIGSLSKALDIEKELAERAFHVHREATRNNDQHHDPEIAQYLEEKFIEEHADQVRKLAGHTSDLKGFITEKNDISLALYLFDEYLQSA